MPAGCPACHRAGQGTSLSNNRNALGLHVLTAKHLRFKEKLQMSHPDEYERLVAWENEHKVAEAARCIQSKRQAAISSERGMDLQFGVSEEANYPSVDMGVASEGKYGDNDEFGYEPDTIQEPGDPMIVDLEPIQVLDNVIDQSGKTSDREDDVDSDSSDSESADMESSSDEQPAGLFYGQNEYFPNHCFFHPPDTAQVDIDEPDNEWFPFDSRVDALLFFYCHSEGAFLSDQQVEKTMWLLKMLAPGLKLPTLKKLKSYRSKIPRPEIARFSDQKNQPYYQISILDTIRMQSCIFQENNASSSLPQQYPEIVHPGDHKPKVLRELWHGEKWHHTPQLNRPMERIHIDGSIKDAWVGDVFELHNLTTGFKYAIYMGCEIHTMANVQEKLYRMLQLTPNNDGSRYYISTYNASPRLDAEVVTLVTEDLILNHIPLSSFAPIYGIDSKNGEIDSIKNAWIKQHPARALCESTGQTTDVRQVNISIWNDGLSGVRSKRWNPFEVWTITLAGLPRKVCMPNITRLTCGDN
jgi:hypothetical protein